MWASTDLALLCYTSEGILSCILQWSLEIRVWFEPRLTSHRPLLYCRGVFSMHPTCKKRREGVMKSGTHPCTLLYCVLQVGYISLYIEGLSWLQHQRIRNLPQKQLKSCTELYTPDIWSTVGRHHINSNQALRGSRGISQRPRLWIKPSESLEGLVTILYTLKKYYEVA